MRRAALLVLLGLLVAGPAPAGQSGLRTLGARTLGAGLLEVGLGAEYASKADAPFAGAPVTLWRAPSFWARWGAAPNVDFSVEWSGRLLAGYKGGASGSDWGDPVVSTVITAFEEEGARPALGLRTAVKIPSTSYLPHYLGSDQADFYCAILASAHAGGVEARLNVGLGIIGNPRELGSQDDVLIVSAGLLAPAGERLTLFAEAYGVSGYKADDDKLLARAGVAAALGGWQVGLFGGARLAGSNGDFAAAFLSSEDWSAGITVSRRFSL